MRDEFAALSQCAAIWDMKSCQATNKFRERTITFPSAIRLASQPFVRSALPA
jgi:hypothetical protein